MGPGVGDSTATCYPSRVSRPIPPPPADPEERARHRQRIFTCGCLGCGGLFFFLGMGLLLVALAIMQRLTPACLWLLPIWASQVLFSIGLIWILSSVNVFMRDLQSIVSVAIMVLMMVSPIAYTEEMIPEGLRPLLKLNPLYYLIMSYQNCLMHGRTPPVEVLLPLFLDDRQIR